MFTVTVYKHISSTRGIEIGSFETKTLAINMGAKSTVPGHPFFSVYDNEKEEWVDF